MTFYRSHDTTAGGKPEHKTLRTTNLKEDRKSRGSRVGELRNRGRVTVAILALLLAGGGYYAYWSIVESRFTTVTKHQLYQSGRMEPDKLIRMAEEHGIRSVVDLRNTHEDAVEIEAERRALENSEEITYYHLPTGHVPSEETVLKFLEIVGDPANRPALVHCRHGTGRSVLFASLFRVEFENWDNETARRAVEPLHWRGNFGPNSVKGKYLISYEPHHARLVFAADD